MNQRKQHNNLFSYDGKGKTQPLVEMSVRRRPLVCDGGKLFHAHATVHIYLLIYL